MILFHRVAILVSLAISAPSHAIDWSEAETRGVLFGNRMVFGGCVRNSGEPKLDVRKAVLRAGANMSRTDNLMVSGEEHAVRKDGATVLISTIHERSEKRLGALHVVYEESATIDGESMMCALVAESEGEK